MTPALVACDLDGTLLHDDGTVTPRVRAALDAVRARGTRVVLATGRPWVVAKRTATEIELESFVITSNGSYTVQAPSGDEFHSVWLDAHIAVQIVERLRAEVPGLGFGIEYERGLYNEAGFAERLPHSIPTREPIEDVLTSLSVGGRVRNVVAFGGDFDDRMPELRQLVEAVVGDVAEVKYAGLPFVQVAPLGVDKAAALAAVCAHLDIDAADVVAFGDEGNDQAMLEWAGTGVAMATAPEHVKAVADDITVANVDEGVAEWLERMLEGTLR